MTTKRTVGLNPLVDNEPSGTIEQCCSVLEWMTTTHDTGGGTEIDYGRSLVLSTVREALLHAGAELKAGKRPHLEVANG